MFMFILRVPTIPMRRPPSHAQVAHNLRERRPMETVLLLEEVAHQPPLRAALCDLGYKVVAELSEIHRLPAEVKRLSPDVIIATTEAPSEEMLVTLGAV